MHRMLLYMHTAHCLTFVHVYSSMSNTQRMVGTTHNPKQAGKKFNAIDKEVMKKLDPYFTTNLSTYRPFNM